MITLAMLICLIPAGILSATEMTEEEYFDSLFVNENGVYLIQSASDWDKLSTAVRENHICKDFTFKQTADFTVDKPIGGRDSSNNKKFFCGTYDGDGHTLTVNLSSNHEYLKNNNSNYCCPFPFVSGVTIKNLRVEGTITAGSNKKFASGLIGQLLDGGTVTNVEVAVTITSAVDGDATHGGVIAVVDSKKMEPYNGYYRETPDAQAKYNDLVTNITNVTFSGKLLGPKSKNSGGFVGFAKSIVNFNECVFAPQEVTFNDFGAFTYARLDTNQNHVGTQECENCYYTTTLGSVPDSDEVVKVETDLPDDGATYEVVSVNGLTLYAPVTGSSVPQFEGYSLRVSGDIGLVFYATIPEEFRSDCYMTFAISGKGTVSGDQAAIDPNMMSGSYYGFVCNVNALQMADTITATLHTSDGKAYSNSHTVAEYISTIVDGNFSDNTKSFAKALADYGHYIQLFQAETRNFSIGTDYAEIDAYNTIDAAAISAAESAVSNYSINKPAENEKGLAKVTFSVGFDSDTSLYVYFTPASDYTGTISAGVGDGTMETLTNKSGKKYFIRISNVGATQFAREYAVNFVADGTGTVGNVSVLAYAHALFENSASYTYADEAAAAIYNYHTAALAYVD